MSTDYDRRPYGNSGDYGSSSKSNYKDDTSSTNGFGFNNKTIRSGFIRRVYSILTIQLLVTLGFVALLCLHGPSQQFVARNSWLMMVAMVSTIVIICAIACCETARRTSPTNMILLSAFTICESFLVGVVSSTYKRNEVLLAIGLTTLIVLALTAFAFQTSIDFTMCGGFMCVLMVLLVGAGIVGIFWRNEFFHFLMACGGALIFSMYIVYDTQMMMGGSHKYSISPEEYVFAALNLYLDIINLFLYLLKIIRYLNND
ncbi:unnamed protein product [Diamesa hyperborea]